MLAPSARANFEIRRALAAVLWSMTALVAHAQQPAPQPEAEPTFRLRTDAVVVDVVVRSDERSPVQGLTAADFDVTEDGVPQVITSFTAKQTQVVRVLSADEIDQASPPAHALRVDASTGDAGVVAVVFDRLSPEGRLLAHRAVRQFIGHGPAAPGAVGIFAITREGINTVQHFTRDYASIRRGVDALGFSRASSVREVAASTPDTLAIGSGTNDGAGPPSTDAPTAPGSMRELEAMQLRMMLGFDMVERDLRSGITQDALLAVISALAGAPGRKSLVLLSEGLDQGPSLRGRLQDVIAAANRANVVIYAVDAAGLRIASPTAGSAGLLNDTGSGGAMLRRMERFETVLLSTPATTLGRLARDTGGAYLQNTNDVARIFTRVTEDFANHYVLTYVSSNATYDRKYRRIRIAVARSGVTVSARHGYYAIAPTRGLVTHAWEAPAVSTLEGTALPNSFPVQFERLVFPTADPESSQVPLIVRADARHLKFVASPERYRAEAVFLVRIRDVNGQVLAKGSDHYVLEGPAHELETSRSQALLFYRQVSLPPGTYEVEAVVHDVQGDRMSVRVGSLDVPRQAPGLPRVGSVFVVEKAQRGIVAPAQADSPLLHNGVLLYPNLAHVIARGQADEVAFAFSVVPMGASVEQATVQLLRGQRVIGETQLQLHNPGSDGRIQQIGSFPLPDLLPGPYVLRVQVAASGRLLTRSTKFTVIP
ncbi:VWA domain-containing protein [Luteitalea sp.]|uniref:VWA domain-containing protein n=1 Tax=Luteitalea sp. TaxID=2004800 RepID=UPI0025C2BE67|nr:VWA domain-containing protein [Luteitalea sp.]